MLDVYSRVYKLDQPVMIRVEDDVYWVDRFGNRYLDLMTGSGAFFLWRYGDENIPKLLSDTASRMVSTSNFLNSYEKIELRNQLYLTTGYPCVFFLCSGSESVEAAVKLAMKKTGRKHILYYPNSYHGRTGFAVQMGPSSYHNYLPGEEYFHSFYSDENPVLSSYAAFVVEAGFPQQSLVEYGEELQEAIKICHQAGIVIIADEIRSSMGRTGHILDSETWETKPDIVVIGKAFCAGMPLTAVLATEEFYGTMDRDWHSSTSGGNPILCALANYLINSSHISNPRIWREIQKRSARMEQKFAERFSLILHNRKGLWWNLFFPGHTASVVARKLQERGVLVYNTNDEHITLLPSLYFTEDHWEIFLDCLESVIQEIPKYKEKSNAIS